MAAFGIENKDNPIMEFQPANKAYQTTPYTGFRTFLKLKRNGETALYEPFFPDSADAPSMAIGLNELELQATSAAHGLQTNVLYFTLPHENFAGLARQVTITNIGTTPLELEMLDGMAAVMPYGVNNSQLKFIARTLEAWMEVFNMEQGVPFYRLRAGTADSAEVETITAGHFYLAFDQQAKLLPAFVDPTIIFGQNTALSRPDQFMTHSLAELQAKRQITTGKTPCGFFGLTATLAPGESVSLQAIIGHVSDLKRLQREQSRLTQVAYLPKKRQEAQQLAQQLTDVISTQTSSALFDGYCRQTFLDNVMRGGWPLILGSPDKPVVYHIYSRKHGDLERDYNAFYVAAEMYSQGNGNYRDVNQNRRCDVLFEPKVGDFNILAFMGLIQPDGYNPLIINGCQFTVSADKQAPILALLEQPAKLAPHLAKPFTPGQLLKIIADQQLGLTVSLPDFIATVLVQAEQQFKATFGEGFWVDHWTYNLDLITTYLSIYPDQKETVLFNKQVSFFHSPATVKPRAQKYVLANGKVRQYEAILELEGEEFDHFQSKIQNPKSKIEVTVFAKLVGLALNKFATLDPYGMGMELEAGKPGWYDALNGLAGLFGSSMCETYELARLMAFLLEAIPPELTLPQEQINFLQAVKQALSAWEKSPQDYEYWDAVATARESYREQVRFGFGGSMATMNMAELTRFLTACQAKIEAGIKRALSLNNDVPPTYFIYNVTAYEVINGANGQPTCDKRGRPYVKATKFEPQVLPLFLEGPVHAMKVAPDIADARHLYNQIKASDLFDRKLKMYKVNASLDNQSHEIGRAKAFTAGWLENESIWLHMEYKYILEVLKAGLYQEFFEDFQNVLIPFQNPSIYGRSPLENSSFIASSAHPDESIHGAGFVARLSGSTAEFLSIWSLLMVGAQPFLMQNDQLCLAFNPLLPGWLFDQDGKISFTFLGHTPVVYHNPKKVDTFQNSALIQRVVLQTHDNQQIELIGNLIGAPHAAMVRAGQVKRIEVFWG